MFLLFVFFFKQKTAYEMRISDWSSDVCSSDLVVRVVVLRLPLVGRGSSLGGVLQDRLVLGGQRIVLGLVEHDLEEFHRLMVGTHHVDLGDVLRAEAPEIGRASCRERVCQYV